MRDPAAGGQFADLPRVERGLGGEVEALEVARAGKMRDLAGHGDAPLVLAGDLSLDQKAEGLAQRHLAPCGFVEQGVELVADRGEFEPRQPARERGVIAGESGAVRRRSRLRRRAGKIGHHRPPPMASSYSASGRSSAGAGSAAGSTARAAASRGAVGRAVPATP